MATKIVICMKCKETYDHPNHWIGGDHKLVQPKECFHYTRIHTFTVDDKGQWVDKGWECEECCEKVDSPPIEEGEAERLRGEIKRLQEYEWKYNQLSK